MSTGTRSGHVDLIHTGRDTVVFRPVYKTEDGNQPADASEKVDAFTLRLGSVDDEEAAREDASVLGPRQSVPAWALAHYRKLTLFQGYEESGKVRAYRAA